MLPGLNLYWKSAVFDSTVNKLEDERSCLWQLFHKPNHKLDIFQNLISSSSTQTAYYCQYIKYPSKSIHYFLNC